MKPKFWAVIYISILGLVLGFFICWPDRKLHLIACDVGQGDAILIKKGFDEVLIDGGPNNKVLECLSGNLPFWEKTIELVVLTHPDSDHVTGLVEVLKRFKVTKVVANSLWVDKAAFGALREAVVGQKISVFSPKNGDRIKLAQMSFEVLWPKEKLGDGRLWSELALKGQESNVLGAWGFQGEINETSVALWLKYGQFDAILTGDIGQRQEEEIALQHEFEGIEILKVAHHGSKYSSSEVFLEKIKPKIALISVGKNPWGHPTKEVLERLRNLGVKTLRTDEQGQIEVVSDGKSFMVK
jgi:competence protein ComEC